MRSLLLLLAVLFTACAPTYLLSMQPSPGSGLWTDGQEMARQQHDSVDVRVCFVRYEVGRLVFSVDFRNRSDRTLTVGPGDFYYQPVAILPAVPPAAPPHMAGRVGAIDPEPQIQALADRVAAESAAATNVSTGELLTSLSHVVDNIASLKKNETKEEAAARETKQQEDNDRYTRQRLEAAAAADQYRAVLQELQTQALRRNTLEPHQQVRGYLYFPRWDEADLIRLSAPGLREGTTLDFAQTRTKQP